MDQVWGGRFVSETAVTSRIKQARKAVGDDGQAQRVIRTVHGRGYHFAADIVKNPAPPVPEPPSSPAPTLVTSPSSAAPTLVTPPIRRGPIRYALSDGLNIAYEITGSGDNDIVLVPGFVSHLELDWANPQHAHFLERLAGFGRLIRFDKRGTGLSDRPDGVPDLETRIHDVRAVMAAAGSRRATLFGYSEGGPMATLFAATHPDLVEALVLYGSYAKRLRAPDYPWAPTEQERSRYAQRLSEDWSWEADMRVMCPSADDEMAQWWGRRARAAATPSTVRALIEMNSLVDVRDVLSAVRVPTLVLHRRGDRDSVMEEGRFLAAGIPDARFVELPGADHFVGVNPDQILDPVEDFLAALPAADDPPDRVLAALVAVSGPEAARGVEALTGGGGRPRVTADGRTVVAFDGPATAIRQALRHRDAGVGFRVSIGEIPRHGAIEHAAAETPVAEVWTSTTVRDLVSGSGLSLEPAGDSAYRVLH
jgi:pimeloyl-ACP methyl ester carboxylesterase